MGAGREATGPWVSFDRLRGVRLTVRDTPVNVVDVVVGHLLAQGFVPGEVDMATPLRQSGSPWHAKLVEIGDDARSWRRGFITDILPGSGAGSR